MKPEERFRLGFRPELDGLRGLAIASVLSGHLFHHGNPGLGVDLFFVLSGFLITCLLIEEFENSNDVSLKNFYMRRILRLAPALLLALTLVWIGSLFKLWPSPGSFVVYLLTYTSNLAIAFGDLSTKHSSNPLVITWSLAIEEQFYMVWPVVFISLAKRTTLKNAGRVLVGLFLLIEAWRAWLIVSLAPAPRIYYGTDSHGGVLLLGCLLAFARKNSPNELSPSPGQRKVWYLGIIGFLYLSMNPPGSFDVYVMTLTLWACGMGALVWASTLKLGLWNRLLSLRPLRYLGRISYGLYLYHVAAHELVLHYTDDGFLSGLLSLILTLLVSSASFHLMEQRFLRLKKRFSKKNNQPRASA